MNMFRDGSATSFSGSPTTSGKFLGTPSSAILEESLCSNRGKRRLKKNSGKEIEESKTTC